MMLVSLDEAKRHLRVDHDDENADLELKIAAASELIVDYLKDAANAFLDSQGEPEIDSAGQPVGIPFKVKAATLLMVGYLYRDRDGDPDKAYEMGFLPRPVTAMLYSKRKPTMA